MGLDVRSSTCLGPIAIPSPLTSSGSSSDAIDDAIVDPVGSLFLDYDHSSGTTAAVLLPLPLLLPDRSYFFNRTAGLD